MQRQADNGGADAALFCSDQKMLHDGRILAAGGTDYYNDTCVDWNETLPPGITPFPVGSAELEGIKNARIFDPATNTWTQTDSMDYGRWYPAAVTLPDGDVFIASGVTRLVKPVYPNDPVASGRNVVQTETYDTSCGTWSNNGRHRRALAAAVPAHAPASERPRLLQRRRPGLQSVRPGLRHGTVEHRQQLRPADQDLDRPRDRGHAERHRPQRRRGHGGPGRRVPGLDVLGDADAAPEPGRALHRGELPDRWRPRERDRESEPGPLLASTLSRVDTINVAGPVAVYSTTPTAPLAAPRWYGSGTLLPNGQVLATSGADKDAVKTPGSEITAIVAELFTPGANTWEQVATQHRERTYHNSATLMRDGRVLVGGHAPITNSYMAHMSLGPPFTPNEGRDPSFEIYSPWYVFRNDRPVITVAPAHVAYNRTAITATTGCVEPAQHRADAAHRVHAPRRRRPARRRAARGEHESAEQGSADRRGAGGERPAAGEVRALREHQHFDGVVPSKGVAVTVGAGVVGACE